MKSMICDNQWKRLKSGSALIAIAVATLRLTPGVNAATVTWSNGAASNDWFTASNWIRSPSSIPVAGDIIYVGANTANAANDGTVIIGSGNALGSQLYLGYAAGTSGRLTIEQAASLTLTGVLSLGTSGTGSLNIAGGNVSASRVDVGSRSGSSSTGYVAGTGHLQVTEGGILNTTSTNTYTIIGYQTGAQQSTVLIDGPGSEWNSSFGMIVGGSGGGSGKVVVQNGGLLNLRSSNSLGLGFADSVDATGSLFVDGLGSKVIASDGLVVGIEGQGFLSISNGAILGSSSSLWDYDYIGYQSTVRGIRAEGHVVVDGQGSSWINYTGLMVGRGGIGTLTISDGASVTSTHNSYIGFSRITNAPYAAHGEVLISGPGSVWSTGTLDMALYNGATAVLTVADGGILRTTDAAGISSVGNGGQGTINIGAAQGEPAVAPGIIDTQILNLGTYGAIVFNHTGTADDNYEFSAPISGSGTVDVLSGVTTLTGLNTYSGTTNVSGGVLKTDIESSFSAASDSVVATGAVLDANGLNQTIASLTNGGTAMIGSQGSTGAVGATLAVTGDYTGNGGSLILRTALGDDNSPTDMLIVGGDTSGASYVKVFNAGGTGAQTVEGIRIIEIGGASDGTFTLLGDYETLDNKQAVKVGAYAYTLEQNGVSTPTDGDWYLRSTPVEKPEEPIEPGQPGTPRYSASVPVYEAYPQALLALNGVSTLQQRVGNRVWAGNGNKVIAEGADVIGVPYASPEEAGTHIEGNGVWGRIEGAHNHIETGRSTTDVDYDQNIFKLQAGVDGMLMENENGKLIGGISVHYAHGLTKTASIYDAKAGGGRISTDGYGFGGTLTWYGENGLYVDAQAQATWYDSDLSYAGGNQSLIDGNDGFGYALSIEGGKRIALDPAWSLTPQAQLVYSSVDFDDFHDADNIAVRLDRGESLQGRLGLTLDHQTAWQNANGMLDRAHVYGIANLYYEFLEGTRVNVADVSFANRKDRLWGGIGLGGSYNWNDDKYSIYGEGLVNTSLNNFADSYALQGNIGFRVKW